MLEEQSVAGFLDDLASKASTPGGGSAAAVMGAMGAALVSMVCNLTIGKKAYADVESDMQRLLSRAEELRSRLSDMVKDDIRVFDQVMSAYGLPKDGEDEKAARSAAIQAALRDATDVPLACASVCTEVIDLSLQAAEIGNANVVSDAGVAVLAASAALRSAALNVYINIGNIKDQDFATSRSKELEGLLAEYLPKTETVYQIVKDKL